MEDLFVQPIALQLTISRISYSLQYSLLPCTFTARKLLSDNVLNETYVILYSNPVLLKYKRGQDIAQKNKAVEDGNMMFEEKR